MTWEQDPKRIKPVPMRAQRIAARKARELEHVETLEVVIQALRKYIEDLESYIDSLEGKTDLSGRWDRGAPAARRDR